MQPTPRTGASVLGRILPVTAAAAMSAVSLQAQSPANSDTKSPPREDVVQLEAYSVTGTNIKRLEQEKTLPVTIITADEIEARDSTTPMDQLAGIAHITNIPENETPTNAVAGRGDNANVALRGLGASNTLVLLNGRRMPFHPFSANNLSSVNVNVLPTFVSQIEILRDGASSIYGSDAVAGVINYVARKKPNGAEVSVRYGVTEHGGGMDVQGRLGYGTTFARGKGSFILGVTAYYRDAIYLREREHSQSSDHSAAQLPPWNTNGTFDFRTATGIWPSFTVAGTTGTQWFYPVNGTPTLTTTALPRALYADYNAYTVGQPMSSRGSLYHRVEYELTPNLRVFGELVGYVSKSQTGRQPITLNSSDRVVTLSADNPFNPFGSRFRSANGAPNADGTPRLAGTPQPLSISTLILADGGPEKTETTNRVYRLLGGLEGNFGRSSWSWEVAGSTSGVRATDNAVNSIRDSKLIAAALRTDATAWNPFGYTFKVQNGAVVADQPYVNPKSVRDTYTQAAPRYGHSRIDSFDGRTAGNLLNLWSGPLAASFGAEWRREMKEDHKDPFVGVNPASSGLDPQDNDILVMSPKIPYQASRTITSAYAEVAVPLVAQRNQVPLIRALELNTAARFEHYSDFGNTVKPKFGLTWRPVSRLLVRASHNQGFHAPDLADLYQPTSFTVASPPGVRDNVRNNFLTGRGLPPDIQVLRKDYNIGNPNLKPEVSKGISVGLGVEVPGIKGLSFTVDYWEITQKSLIVSRTRDEDVDLQLLRAYTQQQLAAGVPLDKIDVGYRTAPGDESGHYRGESNTLRAPVTQADRDLFARANAGLAPASQLATLGAYVGRLSRNVNSDGLNFTNGFDYSIAYNTPRTSIGQFRLSADWAQFLNKFYKIVPTAPKDDDIVALRLPRTKIGGNIIWRKDAWNASLNLTYQSEVYRNATTNLTTYNSLGQPDYIKVLFNNGAFSYRYRGSGTTQVNAGLGYRFGSDANPWLRRTSVRLGITNLLDKNPSWWATAAGYQGSIGSSLWVGRAYSLTYTRDY